MNVPKVAGAQNMVISSDKEIMFSVALVCLSVSLLAALLKKNL